MTGVLDQMKTQWLEGVIVIYKNIFAYCVAYVGFRFTPTIAQYGEFSGFALNTTILWFFNVPSGVAFSIFWLIFLIVIYLSRQLRAESFPGAHFIFGASYSIFEFPRAFIAEWNPEFDWIGILLPYLLSIVTVSLIAAFRGLLKEK